MAQAMIKTKLTAHRTLLHGKLFWMLVSVWLCVVNLDSVFAHLKLNVPRVRLPYFDNLSINFTLQVDTPGCYRWTVSRPDIITIMYTDDDGFEREDADCSDRVVISTVPRASPCCPANAIVYAEEINTKESVRCDIIVDKIHTINIVTTTKELHLEEAPSKFNVRGYGGMNNEFSTMEGVALKWWLESHETSTATVTDPQSIMRFIPFSESMYKASPALAELEGKRLQGSQVLVEGLKTGSVNVFAKISDSLYKNVAAAQVRIVVVTNVVLDPQEVFVVPGAIFSLKLLQMKQGIFTDIKLPSNVYSFDVVNETVATYEAKRSIITARSIGDTKVIVTDKNGLEGSYEEHPLTAQVHVCEPKFLSLTVNPFRNWALMMGNLYEISVDIYDSDNQKIYISDNIQVKTVFESMFFQVEFSSPNGTYHIGKPIKTGNARVIAELVHTRQADGSLYIPTIAPRVQADMNIFQRIAINPKQTILPCDPSISKRREITFTASGGNGNFAWRSTNTSVTSVSQSGQARIEYCGFANVTAAMTINSNIKGDAKVYVLPPTAMKIVEHIVEAEVGTAILVPLAFFSVRPDDPMRIEVPYTNCGDLPFKVEIEDGSFTYDSKTYYPHSKPACVYLPILSTKLGSSLVTVTYSTPTEDLTDSVIVSTFMPLKVVEPPKGITVLAVGSSRQLVFEGGPRPLVERSTGFFRKLLIENTTVAQSYEYKPTTVVKDDLFIYEVICRDIGETLVTLHMGNSKHVDDSRPVSRTAGITVVCAEPYQIYFKVETQARQDGGSKCPNDVSAAQMVRIPIPNYEATLVAVVVKDAKGRKFDNISSLSIDWRTSEPIVTFENERYISTQRLPINGYSTVGKNYQKVIPISKSGNIEITAEIRGYRADVLRRLKINYLQLSTPVISNGEEDSRQLSHSMDLQLVSDLSVQPSELILFNHPSSKAIVQIVEGSGYFELITSGTVLRTKYHANNKTILISPLTFGESTIIVKDLCLFTHRSTELLVRVNGVGSVQVEGVDKLQLSHEAIINVSLFDKFGKELSAEHLRLITLKPIQMNPDILEILPIDQDKLGILGIQYKIKGKNSGQATLSFSAESPGTVTKSAVKQITVFPPLTMEPRNLTIIVGSTYQLISQGGPQIDALTNFSTDTPDIANISANGLIQGRAIGQTKINAKSVDRIPSTKIYSDDVVNVNVIPLKGIRIHAPLTRIQKNYIMPMWAVGLDEGIDPSVLLGGNSPLLSLEWQVSNRETAEIRQMFQSNGYMPPNGDQLSVRFRAKQTGHVVIKLLANYSGRVFVDEMEIEVHDELKLLKYATDSQPLLMTQNSELNLKTNRDASSRVTYHVQTSRGPSCEGKTACESLRDERPVVTVDNSGIVRSLDTLGQAVIFISVRETAGIVKTISVTVEVKSVSYIMINPKLPINVFSQVKSRLPRGLTFPFTISYHDNVGAVFTATSGIANIRPNRFDLGQVSPGVENRTFIIQTVTDGRFSIKVYDKSNPLMKDFLILSVGELIDPSPKSITVGDFICFSCAIKSNDKKSGHWIAEPKDILAVDSTTGLATAVAPGRTHLEYHIDGIGLVTSLDVTVKGIAQVTVTRTAQSELLTNGDPNSEYDFLINFGEERKVFHTSCTGEFSSAKLPFSCELEYDNNNIVTKISETFSVQLIFVPETHQYLCRVSPTPHSKYPYYVSSIKSNILLRVKVKPNAVQSIGGPANAFMDGHIESPPVISTFLPAVYIHTKELNIAINDPHATLLITGHIKALEQVKFIPSEDSNLNVEEMGRVSSNFEMSGLLADEKLTGLDLLNDKEVETRSYLVKLTNNFWTSGNIYTNQTLTIISVQTKQRVTLPVELRLVTPFSSQKYESEGWWGTLGFFFEWGYFLVLTPCVVLLTLYFTQLGYKFHLNWGNGGSSKSNDSVFITSPKHSPTQLHQGYSQRSSVSPSSFGGGGDNSGYVSTPQRLYSTQDTGYLNFRNRDRSHMQQ